MATMTSNQIRREYERLLSMVFGILINGGMRRHTISKMSESALTAAAANARTMGADRGGELATIGVVLDAWCRDRRYLTTNGKPRAVALVGGAPSLEALIRSQNRHADAAVLIDRIKALGLIAKNARGLYKPVGDAALLSFSSPVLLQYLARSLSMLLQTVEENVRRGSTSPRLLERRAEVPDLPVESVGAFLRFSKLQGSTLVRIVNDWLETRRARAGAPSAEGTVRAAVHVYAYVTRTKRRRNPI